MTTTNCQNPTAIVWGPPTGRRTGRSGTTRAGDQRRQSGNRKAEVELARIIRAGKSSAGKSINEDRSRRNGSAVQQLQHRPYRRHSSRQQPAVLVVQQPPDLPHQSGGFGSYP